MTLTISIESAYKDHPKVKVSVSAGMIYGTVPRLSHLKFFSYFHLHFLLFYQKNTIYEAE